MRKWALSFTTLLLIASAEALPIGNPSGASLLYSGLFWNECCDDPCCCIFNFRFGFYGDYVFNRHLRAKNDMIPFGKEVNRSKIDTNAGYLILGLWDLVDLFATIGMSRWEIDATHILVPSRLVIETDSHISWSFGTRATLWQQGCTILGIEAQYFAWKPNVLRFGFPDLDLDFYPSGLTFNYQEWQVGMGISRRIGFLIPYVAVKYSNCFAKFRIDTALFDPFDFYSPTRFKSDQHWGYAIGVTLVDVNRMDVTAEARFGNEKAIHINGQIRF